MSTTACTTTATSPVAYPDTLDNTTSHDDCSSIASSFTSLSIISQPQLLNNASSVAAAGGGPGAGPGSGSTQSIHITSSSTISESSEWDDYPPIAETEHFLIEETPHNTMQSNDQDNNIIERTNQTISEVVQSRSIMFGPIDDSDDESTSSSADDDSSSINEVLLDQSTLTTTTSYTTVLAIDEQKEDDDTKSLSDATVATQNPLSDKVLPRKEEEMTSDEPKEPPISSMLSVALEEIEEAEMSAEEELGDDKNEDDTLLQQTVDRSNTAVDDQLETDYADHALEKSQRQHSPPDITVVSRFQTDELKELQITADDHKETILSHSVPDSDKVQTASQTLHRGRPGAAHQDNAPDILTSSSGELLSAYSKEDMLASSDIMLDLQRSTDNLLVESSEISESQSSLNDIDGLELWELPNDGTVEDKLLFVLEKMNWLKVRQNSILHKMKKENQQRTQDMLTYTKNVDYILSKLEEDESLRKQEKKRQRNRIELIENAVIELGRQYTGQYQPLLGVKPERRSSVSHQKAVKLKNFFGAQPPLLDQFLKDLGYEEYIPRFQNEKISLQELPYLKEEDMVNLGLPLGPRLRILHEAKHL